MECTGEMYFLSAFVVKRIYWNLKCRNYDFRIVDDGYSGTSMDRPAMQELLAARKSRLYYQ